MNNSNKTQVVKDFKEKSILVAREFNAPLSIVWRCYTEPALLDQWWGPAPWRAETKFMNFVAGGYWLYAMVSPTNEKHWGRMNYLSIEHHKSYLIEDAFCDENGIFNPKLPVSRGLTIFTETAFGTKVEFKLSYQNESDVLKLIEMGFEQGIVACFEQLELLLIQTKI